MKVAILLIALVASAAASVVPPVVDACSPFPKGNWDNMLKCLNQKIGSARPVPGNKALKSTDGKCTLGYHLLEETCHPNTAYCVDGKYDKDTFNCTECKWYAFQVQGDLTHFPYFTGDYCRTRWWWFVLTLFLAITGLLLLIALLRYLCCKPKVKEEKKPLLQPKPVEVRSERPPVRVEPRHERGEVREWREEPVVTEHRSGVSHGQRVHVETRTYSPNREVQRVSHGHEDWGKWSQANWQGH
jgi:hypothetical protein